MCLIGARGRFSENSQIRPSIEERVVDVLPASLLPKKLRDQWVGLEDGCIVQYLTRRTNKKTGEATTQIKRAVSSIRWDNKHADVILATALRQPWRIENNLHWTLDVQFRQDRIQCKNGTVLYARAWLNKAALNLLLRYKESVGSNKSVLTIIRSPRDMSGIFWI